MARRYYVADAGRRVRLRPTHVTFQAARQRTEKLNQKSPGRYQCGDWCDQKEVGVDRPHEWPWATQ